MKVYFKYLLFAMFYGIFQTLPYLRVSKTVLFSDIIFGLSFNKPIFHILSIMNMIMDFIPIFLFQILYGTYIYRHFCSASVFYFTRCTNRWSWFLKESIKLYGYIILYLCTLVLSSIVFCMINFGVEFDKGSIHLLCYFFIIFSIWYYITAIIINIIAIMIGSHYSFGIVASVQLLLLLSLDIFENYLPFEENLVANNHLLKINPIAHLVISWHSSSIPYVNNLINTWNIQFSYFSSFAYLGVIAVIITIIGGTIINNKQILVLNRETGGV
jgi:hypothetical protein